jgi:hypothetical protein
MIAGTYHCSPRLGIEVSATDPIYHEPCYRVQWFDPEEGAHLGTIILAERDLRTLLALGFVKLAD